MTPANLPAPTPCSTEFPTPIRILRARAWPALLAACVLSGATRGAEAPPESTLEVYSVATASMLNTLRLNDRILVDTSAYHAREPRNGEIVLFKPPPASGAQPDEEFIMRCVGVPGDVVFARGRKLFRNGRELPEPYAKWSRKLGYVYAYDMKIVGGRVYSRDSYAPGAPGLWTVNGVPVSAEQQRRIALARPGKIPPRKLLVLGDHRNVARDSHFWGLASRASVTGRATQVFWPLTHARDL